MLGRAVAFVRFEAVRGIQDGKPLHEPVALYLRYDACKRYNRHPRVSPDDGALEVLLGSAQEPVEKQGRALRLAKCAHAAPHGLPRRPRDTEAIYIEMRGELHPEEEIASKCALHHLLEDYLALARGKFFGIVDARKLS